MALRGYKPKWKKAIWMESAKSNLTIDGQPVVTGERVFPFGKPPTSVNNGIYVVSQSAKKKVRRKRIAARSKSMAKRMRVYRKEVSIFLAGKDCAACVLIQTVVRLTFKWRKATENHHVRGRSGLLLMDKRYWCPVCGWCHKWIHAHVELARALNLIAQKGDWNKVDRTPVVG